MSENPNNKIIINILNPNLIDFSQKRFNINLNRVAFIFLVILFFIILYATRVIYLSSKTLQNNSYKFNFYEKIVSSEDDINELSSTNNGDFLEEFIFNDGFSFTNEILTFDVNFDGLTDIFASYTELPFQPEAAEFEKHFLIFPIVDFKH